MAWVFAFLSTETGSRSCSQKACKLVWLLELSFLGRALMRNGAPRESILHNVDKVEIGCHLDLLLVLLRRQFLPFGLRKDQLPLSVSCDAYRHGKLRLVRQPAIGNGVLNFVTLQLQSRNVLMPQVLIENRG